MSIKTGLKPRLCGSRVCVLHEVCGGVEIKVGKNFAKEFSLCSVDYGKPLKSTSWMWDKIKRLGG